MKRTGTANGSKRNSIVSQGSRDIEDIGNVSGTRASGAKEDEEDVETLRHRLLTRSHDHPSALDSVTKTEDQNQYHESFQKELIDALPSMVGSIKEQALQFQDLLKQDAVLLKKATENFESSDGKFGHVNKMLNQFQKEGKLSWWFYVRVIGVVLVVFLVFVLFIRIIPSQF
ncbi:unnamed protein product [Ambrosiozyma monospora]|uniref:Unnamed protein product n=1 Tax=Ambrosiozyma monospora TaxID=43982 RepID=A0ACB5T7S2_AMBMO|nr:unnamed protein product [Ambrosiozyma monospora]